MNKTDVEDPFLIPDFSLSCHFYSTPLKKCNCSVCSIAAGFTHLLKCFCSYHQNIYVAVTYALWTILLLNLRFLVTALTNSIT